MENSNGNHYDFMKLAITNQNSVRQPQIVFLQQKNLAIKDPDREASRISIFKNFENVCMCEEQSVPIVTLGSFSNGFSDGFDN